ncbi:MAG: hypothetical protein KBT47_02180 [Armatimonadetes bacterium]|nr:hypothetical protein [Candidatus Hippobium faecium]
MPIDLFDEKLKKDNEEEVQTEIMDFEVGKFYNVDFCFSVQNKIEEIADQYSDAVKDVYETVSDKFVDAENIRVSLSDRFSKINDKMLNEVDSLSNNNNIEYYAFLFGSNNEPLEVRKNVLTFFRLGGDGVVSVDEPDKHEEIFYAGNTVNIREDFVTYNASVGVDVKETMPFEKAVFVAVCTDKFIFSENNDSYLSVWQEDEEVMYYDILDEKDSHAVIVAELYKNAGVWTLEAVNQKLTNGKNAADIYEMLPGLFANGVLK